MNPEVSVILPVFNAEKYVGEAIRSILNQTFPNFELLIINDGSRDSSQKVIDSFSDPRIIKIQQENIGLAATLNKGMALCRSPLIARQDNDDISHPQRLQLQFTEMQKRPGLALLGTCATIVNESNKETGREHLHPAEDAILKFRLLFRNPFVHSTVMFRKEVAEHVGGYDYDLRTFEDFNLWSKISRVAEVANLPQRLLRYREVSTGMSKQTKDYVERVRWQATENLLELDSSLSAEEGQRIADMVNGFFLQHEDYRGQWNFLTETLSRIKSILTQRYNLSSEMLSQEERYLRNSFRRHYYNLVLRSAATSKRQKFTARVMRQWLYFTHRSLFSGS